MNKEKLIFYYAWTAIIQATSKKLFARKCLFFVNPTEKKKNAAKTEYFNKSSAQKAVQKGEKKGGRKNKGGGASTQSQWQYSMFCTKMKTYDISE